jgi:hypothetical protein
MSTTNEPTGLTVSGAVHFGRRGKGGRKELHAGPAPAAVAPGRVPRVARLMALALRFDRLIREGVVADYAELARLGHVTRARVSQVMSLLNLASDIQEEVLFLPAVERGRDPIVLHDLLPIAAVADWRKQRRMWDVLANEQVAPHRVGSPRGGMRDAWIPG